MLQIRTTGLSDYVDGSSNLKILIVGGPGVGKTRSSSFYPKPIYADCENGRASLADRQMPYAEISSSKDMLDFLAHLKSLESTPKAMRKFQTVVIDTLDGFQRKVKDEWVLSTRAATFTGYEAWGYLDSKMAMLMTRLLNLDYNVIVLVHHQDKSTKDDGPKEIELQLAGSIRNTAFNDFDLVGYMGKYWDVDPATGERAEFRGLTFQATPDKPFLKDRLAIAPKWLPINFTENDYMQLFNALMARLDALPESGVLDSIPDFSERGAKPASVVAPAPGGPLPASKTDVKATAVIVADMSKIDLIEKAKSLGLTVKGNALKHEIITAIETKQAEIVETPTAVGQPSLAVGQENEAVATPDDQAVELVATELGGEVIDVVESRVAAVVPFSSGPAEATCETCGKSLAGENQDFVQLAYIKTQKDLCNACYKESKKK
jgi:hypothetical protein